MTFRELKNYWPIVLMVALALGLKIVLAHLPHPVAHHYGDFFRASIVVLIGAAISFVVERWLRRLSSDRIGSRSATSLRFLGRLVLYLAIALGVLAALGVGLSSAVFGSAFLSVILGLAGQNFLANLIAGIGLIIFRPFEVGDRIQFVTWQFSVLMPSFAHEAMKPTYSGRVSDINLAYTTLITDEGVPLEVPNGIMMQAAIQNHQRRSRYQVRMRFDLDLELDAGELIDRLRKRLPTADVGLADVGVAQYGIVVRMEAQGKREDNLRHEVLEQLLPIVRDMRYSVGMESAESH
ncbi:mechanosensitive ion channel family protein [Sulfobacillus harzensis]|uniref:Mechanosensitive ion channel family protein n=1 Tax=Sulfobacillus harzensis TaxID=2729629 RepID=A0A7Y0L1P0_9FIRM|nr:mechanosensitive ion channel family protein [Sulfobacillus harzensis]NMP21638.1 mechanosensitive ion channel family protein [Sulfobacillus harzensis]